MAIIRYNTGDAGDAFHSTTGANINLTSTSPLTGTQSWAYTSASVSNLKNWYLSTGQPTTYSVWMRFRVSSYSASSQRLLRMSDSVPVNGWHVDLSAAGKLRLRPANTATLLNEMTATVALDTVYIVQVDANHTTGVLTYRLRSENGTSIESYTSDAGQSISTNGDRLDVGAILGSVTGLNYLFELYWADTYEGPTGASIVNGDVTYALTITHATDAASVAARTYEVDATGSTGVVTLGWNGANRGTITESPTGVFTIADPDDGNADLSLTLTAAGTGGGDNDNLGIIVPRASPAARRTHLTFQGGTVGDLANWE